MCVMQSSSNAGNGSTGVLIDCGLAALRCHIPGGTIATRVSSAVPSPRRKRTRLQCDQHSAYRFSPIHKRKTGAQRRPSFFEYSVLYRLRFVDPSMIVVACVLSERPRDVLIHSFIFWTSAAASRHTHTGTQFNLKNGKCIRRDGTLHL